MITVKKLFKRFGPKVVLRGLDFQVEPGEFVALLGPNGAGKTTFLRILASLSRPLTGTVRIAGYQLPGQAAAVRARLGVVSHLPLLYGTWSDWESVDGILCVHIRVGCSSAWQLDGLLSTIRRLCSLMSPIPVLTRMPALCWTLFYRKLLLVGVL